ncbi:MAG: HipA family kinase [Kofleriaceae bacterium]
MSEPPLAERAPLPRATAARFVTALREGGSMPGLIEDEAARLWVVKFRGAGQGPGALLAEVVCGRLARALGLPMPELTVLTVPPRFGVSDGDPEVNELLAASVGENLGMAFLPEALGYDPAARVPLDAELAARVVAFDVLVSNVDRTFRNPNLLWSGGQLWLIDHGAALYWQHGWDGRSGDPAARLPRFGEHVLLPRAGALPDAAAWVAAGVTDAALDGALAAVPDDWLGAVEPTARRAAFAARLARRREHLVELLAAEAGRA